MTKSKFTEKSSVCSLTLAGLEIWNVNEKQTIAKRGPIGALQGKQIRRAFIFVGSLWYLVGFMVLDYSTMAKLGLRMDCNIVVYHF